MSKSRSSSALLCYSCLNEIGPNHNNQYAVRGVLSPRTIRRRNSSSSNAAASTESPSQSVIQLVSGMLRRPEAIQEGSLLDIIVRGSFNHNDLIAWLGLEE